MVRKLYTALDIHDKMRGWTVLVQVIERSHVQTSKPNPKQIRFRRLMLTDSEGTKIPAVIYDNDIRFFHHLLLPYKKYYVSNAAVRTTLPQYRIGDYQYSWVINNTTLVEELVEPIPATIPCTFQICKFRDLFKYADTENLQNIQAFVLHAFPSKESGAENSISMDFIIVNEEKMPMLLKLWNEFDQTEGEILATTIANAPVIIAMRVKVTTFHSLSLTTRASSCLLINPPTQEAKSLREWYNANSEELRQLLNEKAYKDGNRLLPPPNQSDIVPIKVALAFFANTSAINEPKTAWIKATPKLIPGQPKYWYTACTNCQKSVQAEIDWNIKCPACKEEAQVEVRCRMAVVLADESGVMNATVYGLDAEKLVGFTAIQLKQALERKEQIDEQMAASIEKNSLLCFVRPYGVDFRGHTETKYNVIKVYTKEMVTVKPVLIACTAAQAISLENEPAAKLKTSVTKEELFTPTTKLILEEVANQPDESTKWSSTSSGVKRSLTFVDSYQADASGLSSSYPQTDAYEEPAVEPTIQPSPSKKSKDKIKMP